MDKDNHRIAPRHRVLKAGTIEFGGGGIDCTVRNVSDTGAALEVTSPVGIPERFTLVVPQDNIAKPCRVMWRKEKRIGVAFVSNGEAG
jgi:PilZ domain